MISGRVIPPAIGLIVVAVCNCLICLYFIFSSMYSLSLPDKQFVEQATMFYPPEMKAEFNKNGPPPQVLKNYTLVIGVGGGSLGLILSLLTMFGAIRMMSLKSYGLAVFVSVLAMVPCVSCVGCCGMGEGIGIWSLIVLLSPEVRAAFR